LKFKEILVEIKSTTHAVRRTLLRRAGLLCAGAALTFVLAGCPKGGGGSVATVNGEAITHGEIDSHLEATSGDSALRQLIDYSLVMQKLKAEGLSLQDDQVNKQIEKMRKANPQLDEVIQVGGPRMDALQRRVRYEMALNMLLTKDIKVDDKTLKTWFDKHHTYYDQPTRLRVGFLLSSSKDRADTMETQLTKKTKSFQELVDEQKKANDEVAQQSTAESPTYMIPDSLPPELRSDVAKLKKGEISKVLSIGNSQRKVYVIVRVTDRQDALKADFTANHDELEMDYKLEQVARQLNSENPSNPPFEKSIDQVKAVVQQQNQSAESPQYRDILNFINQTAVNKLLQSLRTAAKVDIEDPAYKAVGDDFKTVPGAESATTESAPAPAAKP
jgi:foldase protein PrsA